MMPSTTTIGRFRRELLPPAAQFWKSELAPRRLSRPSRGWARTTCPCHKGDNPTAFSVNLEFGAFYCHACGAKGGDIIAFVQQRDAVDFKTAAKSLGAWDDVDARTDGARGEMAERQLQRERIDRGAEKLAAMERELRLECRDRIHGCDRVLSAPGPWDEAQWQRAHCAVMLRDGCLLPAYTLLSFGALAERARYIMHPDRRNEMTATLHLDGGLRNDHGRWTGVLG
jgi:hypothetical protein